MVTIDSCCVFSVARLSAITHVWLVKVIGTTLSFFMFSPRCISATLGPIYTLLSLPVGPLYLSTIYICLFPSPNTASSGTERSDWWDWGCEPFSLIKFVVWLWWLRPREAGWQQSLQQTDWAQQQIMVKTEIRRHREYHKDVQTEAT